MEEMPTQHVTVSPELVTRYELVQFALGLVLVFGCALIFRIIGEGFHRRHTYTETFLTVAYSMSPIFLLRIFDALPALNTWVCWGVGIALAVAVLYRGIPRIMKPDPSNALGLYLMCSLLLVALTGLSHYFSVLVLNEKVWTGSARFWNL
jgi:hypothetical protein